MDEAPALSPREQILDAALAVTARKGQAKTTMRDVAAQAGVALGLPSYYFGSRQGLLRAVLARTREQYLARVAAQVPDTDGPETLRQLLEMTRALLEFNADWYRLITDLDATSLRDASLAEDAAAIKQAGETEIRRYIDIVANAAGESPRPDGAAIAAVALSAFDGLAVRSLTDPTFDHLAAFTALEQMLLALIAPGQTAPKRPWNTDPLGSSDPSSKE